MKVKGHAGFLFLGVKFQLVSHSNFGSDSHRFAVMNHCVTDDRDALSDKGRSRSVSDSVLEISALCAIGHTC